MIGRAVTPIPMIAAGLLAFGTGCSRPEPPRLYPFRGTVVNLDRNTNVATIRNERIDGWMEPMIMDYPVENTAEYLSLHTGDRITATVHVTSDGYWLTNVKQRQGD